MFRAPRHITLTAAMKEALRKVPQAHKFTHGHALVLTGGAGRTGAARLAARGALRIGAGLVTLGVPPSAQMEVAAQITALMLCRVDGAEALTVLLGDPRITALCMGPGMGVERAASLLPAALARAVPVVLDADALSALGAEPALFAALHEGCVLTPHEGEFARLFPTLATRLADAPGCLVSRVEVARSAAAQAGCTVLLKGACTIVARPDGACALHEARAPWLATAGSGDVLAGFITGLLARGLPGFTAAQVAVYIHAEAARCFGPGLIAEDLPETVPRVFAQMGL